MSDNSRLINVKGRRLKRLIEIVRRLRPNVKNLDWHRLEPDNRKLEIETFLNMQRFDAKEMQEIIKHVFSIKLPVRAILSVFIFMILSVSGYIYYQFLQFPRVYAIGNKVPVYEDANFKISKILRRLDLYGRSVSDSSQSKSENSMLLVKENETAYVAHEDDFFKWILNKNKDCYLDKGDVVSKKEEYEEYERIFDEVKNLSFLNILISEHRKAIYKCINSENQFFNAVVSNTITLKELNEGYHPFDTARGPNEERYVFLCLKPPGATYKNVKITLKNRNYINFEEISYLNKTFDLPLIWLTFRKDPQQSVPFIRFKEESSRIFYESLIPPYESYFKKE